MVFHLRTLDRSEVAVGTLVLALLRVTVVEVAQHLRRETIQKLALPALVEVLVVNASAIR